MFKAIKSALAQTFEKPYKDVNASEFEKLRQAGAQVVDARTPGEISQGKVPKALEMDIMNSSFRNKISKLDVNKPILVYCRSGNRSKSACSVIARSGATEVYNLMGGFSAWESRKG